MQLKRTPCKENFNTFALTKCPNMKCTYEGYDGERYRCEVCQESIFFDYEDMK